MVKGFHVNNFVLSWRAKLRPINGQIKTVIKVVEFRTEQIFRAIHSIFDLDPEKATKFNTPPATVYS